MINNKINISIKIRNKKKSVNRPQEKKTRNWSYKDSLS